LVGASRGLVAKIECTGLLRSSGQGAKSLAETLRVRTWSVL